MKLDEFALIVKAIRTYYPKEHILPNAEAVALWYEELKDLEYQDTYLALRKWVSTNKWSPSIAEIRETVAGITNKTVKDWSEAFEDARAAVRRYGRYNPNEALESLDELTRETVKRMGYYDLCASENHSADRANFRDIYNILAERRKNDLQMSPSVLAAIEQTAQKLIGGE